MRRGAQTWTGADMSTCMAITLSIDNPEHSVRSPACNAMQCELRAHQRMAWRWLCGLSSTAGRPRRIPGRCSPVKSKHHQRRCVERTQASSVRVRSIGLSSELLRSRFRGQKNKLPIRLQQGKGNNNTCSGSSLLQERTSPARRTAAM